MPSFGPELKGFLTNVASGDDVSADHRFEGGAGDNLMGWDVGGKVDAASSQLCGSVLLAHSLGFNGAASLVGEDVANSVDEDALTVAALPKEDSGFGVASSQADQAGSTELLEEVNAILGVLVAVVAAFVFVVVGGGFKPLVQGFLEPGGLCVRLPVPVHEHTLTVFGGALCKVELTVVVDGEEAVGELQAKGCSVEETGSSYAFEAVEHGLDAVDGACSQDQGFGLGALVLFIVARGHR